MQNFIERAMFIASLVIIFCGCVLINGQNKALKELRKRNNKYEFQILELNINNTELKRIAELKTVVLEDNEYFLPVDDPYITSGLGLRISPLTGLERVHYGTDMYSNRSMNVYASKDGEIITHYPPPDGYHKGHPIYGAFIELKHKNGMISYAHMAKTSVREGQEVKAGDIIGTIGETGLSVGKHLHVAYYLDIFNGG